MKKKTAARTLFAGLLFSLILSGCQTENAGTASGETVETETDETETDGEGGVFSAYEYVPSEPVQRILDANLVKIGVDASIPGLGKQGKTAGIYEGLEIDLACEIASVLLGCPADEAGQQNLCYFETVTERTWQPMLSDGALDFVIAAVAVPDESGLEQQPSWHAAPAWYTDSYGLLAGGGTGIGSAADTDGRTIGVVTDSGAQEAFLDWLSEQSLQAKPVFEEFPDFVSLSAALDEGSVEAACASCMVLSACSAKAALLPETFGEVDYAIVCRWESEELGEKADQLMMDLKNSGTLARLYEKWNLE